MAVGFLFQSIKTSKSPEVILKLLYIANEAINTIGVPFCKAFMAEDLHHIHNLKQTKSDISIVLTTKRTNLLDDYVLHILASNYYNFVFNFAHYYEDIQAIKALGVDEIHKSFFSEDYVPIVQLITFKNVVKYCFKVLSLLPRFNSRLWILLKLRSV